MSRKSLHGCWEATWHLQGLNKWPSLPTSSVAFSPSPHHPAQPSPGARSVLSPSLLTQWPLSLADSGPGSSAEACECADAFLQPLGRTSEGLCADGGGQWPAAG
jgi:hypothetical protein